MNCKSLFKLFTKIALHLAVGGVFLYLALKQVQYHELKAVMHNIKWQHILLALGFYWAAILVRIFRWQLLLQFIQPLSFLHVARALIVGYAANNLIPARAGELIRADYCKLHFSMSRTTALGTIFIERIADGLVVVSCLFVGASYYMQDNIISDSISWLMYASIALFMLLTLALFSITSRRLREKLLGWQLFHRIPGFIMSRLRKFRDSIMIIRSHMIIKVMLLSLVIWCLDSIAVWSLLLALDVHLSIMAMLLTIGVVSLSTLLPSPPGFMGTMQFAFTIVMAAFGYTAAQGVMAATVDQIFLLGSITIPGLILLLTTYVHERTASAQAIS